VKAEKGTNISERVKEKDECRCSCEGSSCLVPHQSNIDIYAPYTTYLKCFKLDVIINSKSASLGGHFSNNN